MELTLKACSCAADAGAPAAVLLCVPLGLPQQRHYACRWCGPPVLCGSTIFVVDYHDQAMCSWQGTGTWTSNSQSTCAGSSGWCTPRRWQCLHVLAPFAPDVSFACCNTFNWKKCSRRPEKACFHANAVCTKLMLSVTPPVSSASLPSGPGCQAGKSQLRTNNQWLSLTDQLRLGVRALELDTHFVQVRGRGLPFAVRWLPWGQPDAGHGSA